MAASGDAGGGPLVPGGQSAVLGVLLVVTTFLVYVPVAGFAQSFGVFVEMFDRDFCRPNNCLDLLALVSALAISNFRLLCWVQVLLERWFSVPTLFMAGTVLCFLSMIFTGYVNSVYQLLITHSLLYGFGSTFMLNAPLSAIDRYFPESHRYHILASGIVNLGPSIGVVVMNPLSVYLDNTERYSWRDTLKIFAVSIFVVAVCHILVLAKTYYCQPLQGDSYESLEEPEDKKSVAGVGGGERCGEWSPRMWLSCGSLAWLIGIFGISTAIFIPKTMFMNYMVQEGLSLQRSAMILSLSGVSETVLSLVISFTGDLLGRTLLLVYMLATIVLSTFNAMLPFVSGEAVLIAYCMVHGACDGLLMTVLYGVTTMVVPPGGSHSVLWSVTNLVIGMGQIAGLPAAGLMYDIMDSYDFIFISASGVFALSSCMFGGCFAYLHLKQKTADAVNESEPQGQTSKQDDAKPP